MLLECAAVGDLKSVILRNAEAGKWDTYLKFEPILENKTFIRKKYKGYMDPDTFRIRYYTVTVSESVR